MITPNEESRTQNLTLPLFNLSCSGDARTVERLLKHAPGVLEVYANPATEKAYIEYDPALTNENQLAAVVKNVGYGPTKGRE